jgi:hypothetical protein
MADPVNASIVTHFQSLEDPRIARTKKHNLLDILVIALCTLLTGGEGFQDMELFGRSKRAWLQTFLAQGDRTILTRLLFLLHSVCPVAQGNPILSCSGEHGQQVVFVQTT